MESVLNSSLSIRENGSQSMSSSALRSFQAELTEQYSRLYMPKKQSSSILPQINQISRYKKQNKKNNTITVDKKADEVENRIYKLEKKSDSLTKSQLQNIINISEHQQARKMVFPPQFQYQQPVAPPPYYNPPFYPPQPPYHYPPYHPPPYAWPNPEPRNSHVSCQQRDGPTQNPKQNEQKIGRKVKISENRIKFLVKRMKIAFKAVYFLQLFKSYTRALAIKKLEKFMQLEGVFLQHQSIEYELFVKFQKYDLYRNFERICQQIETKKRSQQNQVSVPYQQGEVILNLKATQTFLSDFLDNIALMIRQGEFDIMYPIFSHFLQGSYPLSHVFAEQQLKYLNLNEKVGSLKISTEMSKLLMVNYFFIKIYIYQMLGKNYLANFIQKTYRKRYEEKKFILMYSKKLTITLVLIYESLNSIFFSSAKKQTYNYSSLPEKIKVNPVHRMAVAIDLGREKSSKSQRLIHEINCSLGLKQSFIKGFVKNWQKIKAIADMLYQGALNQRNNNLKTVKEEVLRFKFPKESELQQLLKSRLKMRQKIALSHIQKAPSNNSNESEGEEQIRESKNKARKKSRKNKTKGRRNT